MTKTDWTAEEVREKAHAYSLRGDSRTAAMLDTLAERIEANESAVPVAWLVVDAKGKRFTIYNQKLAEAIKQVAEQSGSMLKVAAVCEVPPEGWYCTRGADHEGPCAAWPNQPAQEQPGWKVPDVVAGVMCDCWKVAHLFHSGEGMLAHVKRALDDAYASPTPPKEK